MLENPQNNSQLTLKQLISYAENNDKSNKRACQITSLTLTDLHMLTIPQLSPFLILQQIWLSILIDLSSDRNQIESLEILTKMPLKKIKKISLSFNKIQSMKSFRKLDLPEIIQIQLGQFEIIQIITISNNLTALVNIIQKQTLQSTNCCFGQVFPVKNLNKKIQIIRQTINLCNQILKCQGDRSYQIIHSNSNKQIKNCKLLKMQSQEQKQLIKSSSTSNQIILCQDNNVTQIFLPAFMSLQIKHFTAINIDEIYAELSASLRLLVYYGTLPEHVIQYIEKRMRLNFFDNPTIIIFQDDTQDISIKRKKKIKDGKRVGEYIIRAQLRARIDPFVYLTPFQLLDLIVTVSLGSTVHHVIDNRYYNFSFNLMDLNEEQKDVDFQKVLFTESGSINYYDLAENKLCAQYTKQKYPQSIYILKPTFQWMKRLANWVKERRKKREKKQRQKLQKQQKIQQEEVHNSAKNLEALNISSEIHKNNKMDNEKFNYAHFHLPIYKFPFVSLATIYFPLWLLGVINLALYWAENNLGRRLQGISLLTLGYVQLILVVRQQIPVSPSLTLIQLAVYLNLASTVLLLIESLIIRSQSEDQQLANSTGFYGISALILFVSFIGPVVSFAYHRIFVIPSYNITTNPSYKKLSYWNLKPDYNKDANQYFDQRKNDYPSNFIMENSDTDKYEKFIKQNFSHKEQWIKKEEKQQ